MVAPIEASNLGALAGVRHGFFTREGGVSGGIYQSLNAGFGSRDRRAAVAENRARVAHALGGTRDGVQTPYQVHSADALIVDMPFPEGANAPRADALVTAVPGLVIGVLAADCAPVLFADAEARVVAAAHAGWKGALGGILGATVSRMEDLGACRRRIQAAIGPTINQDNYEVGPEFEERFTREDQSLACFFAKPTPGGRAHFDLPGYVRSRLLELDLGCVEIQSPCTYQNESLFFSFRRATHRNEPDYGRHISAILMT